MEEALVEGAVIVEWPERAGNDWFSGEIRLEITSETDREIHMQLRSAPGKDG
jgi:tRNA A37 threonylcarbamoyladenosine biosynthesis protein TsaE